MKKILWGLYQTISFYFVYIVVVLGIYWFISAIITLICEIPILQVLLTHSIVETVVYTFAPLISAIIIISIMSYLFKDSGIYLIPFILMLALLAYTNIEPIVASAQTYGIFSWETLNTIWQSVILCGIICYALWNLFKTRLQSNKGAVGENNPGFHYSQNPNHETSSNYTEYADGRIEYHTPEPQLPQNNTPSQQIPNASDNPSNGYAIGCIILGITTVVLMITTIYFYSEMNLAKTKIDELKHEKTVLNAKVLTLQQTVDTLKGKNDTVWVIPQETYYHQKDCAQFNNKIGYNIIEMSKDEAAISGYITPCPDCN